MVNLVQTAEVKTTVIAGLQRLGLGDAPVYKGVLLVFTAPCFIGGDTDIMQSAQLAFEPVDLLADQVGFELPGTPAHPDSRPAVTIGRNTQPCPVLQTLGLLLRFVEHEVFKALGVAQGGDMQAPLPVQVVIQLGKMGIHLRELHAGISRQHGIPRSIISRSIAVLSLPPDRLTAWNCFCGSLRMVVPIGDSLCVSPHF